jgi:hypothetical protein
MMSIKEGLAVGLRILLPISVASSVHGFAEIKTSVLPNGKTGPLWCSARLTKMTFRHQASNQFSQMGKLNRRR